MKGLVLAGGTATRMNPLTKVTNKHLLPVYHNPMIFYPLHSLAGMGVKEVMMIVGGRSVGDILELLSDGRDFGLDLTYKFQRGALGIAHAISLAKGFVGDDKFVVILGDNIIHGDLRPMAEEFETKDYGAACVLKEVPDPHRFGVAEFREGVLVGLEEKPEHPKANSIIIAVYFFTPDVFKVLATLKPSKRGEYEITDVLNHYIKTRTLKSFHLDGEWTDAGTFESLFRASRLVKEKHIK